MARAQGVTLKHLDGAPFGCTCSKSSWMRAMICYCWNRGDLHPHCQSLTSSCFLVPRLPYVQGVQTDTRISFNQTSLERESLSILSCLASLLKEKKKATLSQAALYIGEICLEDQNRWSGGGLMRWQQLSLLSFCGGRESQGTMVVAERTEVRLYRLACMITDTQE